MSNKFLTYANIEKILQKIATILNKKQDMLVNGANIKTINGNAVLGSGDLFIGEKPVLPEYWMDYIELKAAEINTLNQTYGAKGESFFFITDTHYPNDNNGNGIKVINELSKRISARKVIWGGDIVANLAADKMIEEQRRVAKEFDNDLEVHPLRGNHEVKQGNTANEFWDAHCRKIGNYCTVDGNMYYYRDDNATKMRYIMTDFVNPDAVMDGDEVQIGWMKERILELESGWTVLVVTHGFFVGQNPSVIGQEIVNALDEVYDSAKASIIGVMSGHIHTDLSMTFDKGYVGIATIADNATACPQIGSFYEQAFDVVNVDLENGIVRTIRVGRGNNRQFTYTVK